MTDRSFRTVPGRSVPTITREQMRAVDRVAVEDVGLALLSMMENAGRNLTHVVREQPNVDAGVTILAGDGGNGGGGLVCARHLANQGTDVSVVLDRPGDELTGATATQFAVVDAMDVSIGVGPDALAGDTHDSGELANDGVIVDGLVGYGLVGALRGIPEAIVNRIPTKSRVVSLDVPTGRDATTGEEPGPAIDPDVVVTLALPKTGLIGLDATILLGDIAIPRVVYERLDIPNVDVFEGEYLVELIER